MKIDRRSFLSLGIGVAAGTALSPLPWKLTDDLSIWTQNWPWTPVPETGENSYVNSVCTLCPGGCGISVRKVDERGVKNEGMKGHPVNQGGICALGLSGLQLLYGPTRIKTPLIRVGKRGEGQWDKISWEQAVSVLAEKLDGLRASGNSHTVAGIARSRQGTVSQLFSRFLTAYGSPNFFYSPSSADTYQLALQYMNGVSAEPGFDVENADFILSFGCGLLEGWGSPVWMFKADAGWKKAKSRVIQVEPRLSHTAAKSDRWITIVPGTEAALAMGIAHVLIKEMLYNKDFVDNYAVGFEDFVSDTGETKKGFKQTVLEDYSPETVARATGIDPSAIILLAREFAKAKAPLALCGKGQGRRVPGSLNEAMAVHALNALVGSVNRKGGVCALPRMDSNGWAEVSMDTVAAAGMKQPRLDGALPNSPCRINQIPAAILSGKGYPLNVLFVLESNPLYTLADSKKVKEAFDKIPFVVSMSSYMDETTQVADLVLPNHIYLERLEDCPTPRGFPKPIVSLSKPVVKPQLNTKHAGDTLILLAKELGGGVAEALPWDNFEACFEQAMGDKLQTLQKKGFWVDSETVAPDWKTAFKTPSGKFQFMPADVSPGYMPVKIEGDSTYPLLLIPYETMRLASGYIADPPFLIKTVEDTILKHKDSFIEINPKTAQSNQLSEGDFVVLQTPRGQARVRVHLEEGIMPGVVALPRGLGHTAYDGYIAEKGINVNLLIGPVQDPVSGLDAAWGIRAKLSKA
jgi:menaquinone reductase, molybdopterin-binding-like subunit